MSEPNQILPKAKKSVALPAPQRVILSSVLLAALATICIIVAMTFSISLKRLSSKKSPIC